MDLERACMSKDDFILTFSWLTFGWLFHHRLEINFPWNFEDIVFCLLASGIAFKKSKAILILEPMYIKLALCLWKLIEPFQESPKRPSSITNNSC